MAQDTPAKLIRQLDRRNVIEFVCDRPDHAASFRETVVAQEVTVDGARVFLYTNDVAACLAGAIERAEAVGTALNDLRVRGASLEDVFIEHTGHGIRE